MWPGTRRGEVVVNVVMDLDGVMRDDAELPGLPPVMAKNRSSLLALVTSWISPSWLISPDTPDMIT